MKPDIIRDRIKVLERQIANLKTGMRLHRVGSRPWERRNEAKKRLQQDLEHLRAMVKDHE